MNFKERVRHQFNRAAKTYNAAAVLQHKVVEQLLEYLPAIKPRHVLDLGSGTGYGLQFLAQRYPAAQCYGLDFAEKMLQENKTLTQCAGDFDVLPFADASFDLIFSSLALQWSLDLPVSLMESARVLRSGGALLFTTLVEGTLIELNKSQFLTPSQVLAALGTEFELIQHRYTTERFEFASPEAALKSLKAVGATASLASHGVVTPSKQLSYEVMYIIARKKI